MATEVANVVEAILTAILQWRVAWLEEQKKNAQPPPICRSHSKKLKITYDDYKDYESTFVPLLMHEIWGQIFDEWTRLETDLTGSSTPMDVDEEGTSSNPLTTSILTSNSYGAPKRSKASAQQRQFYIGVTDLRKEGEFQLAIRCQYIVESRKASSHMKVIGEGDLVRLDVATNLDVNQVRQNQSDYIVIGEKNLAIIGLFGYVKDVSMERVTRHTKLASTFGDSNNYRDHHAINYTIVIAKRVLRLKLNELMRLSALYYLKPMIRQIEAVAMIKESCLASDILIPKMITCQLAIPTVVSIKSPHYNDAQYRAIIGANEALSRSRSIPKIQLIQGPPGTGKTHTLIGIIKHFYMSATLDTTTVPKILICTPSNGAIDEVAKRLYRERDFSKKGPLKRAMRLLRVGHPDQISESVKSISLDELVENNHKMNVENTKKKHAARIKELEDELSRSDVEITNLRYSNKQREIPEVEAKIARLYKNLEEARNSETIQTRREAGEASRSSLRYTLVKNADIILTTLNSCQRQPLDSIFRKDDRGQTSFHCVIVDEASQCVEPELLMPLCYRISKMILIGDPMQLPATVISRHAQEFDFGRSLFERFFIHFGRYEKKSPIAMLTEQYRMHPEICRFPSEQFYDNRLITSRKPVLTYPFKPYILFEIRHGTQKSSSTSLENEVEASLIKNLLQVVVSRAPEKSEIGVITPYKGQRRLLTSRISSLQSQRQIKVDINTCDGFQGQEKDIIILSCVRTFESNRSVGFLKSFQRVNVALTRAKHCLIVCLSGKAVSKDKTWQTLIRDAIDRNVIQTLLSTPSPDKFVKMVAASRNGHASTPGTSTTRPSPTPSGALGDSDETDFSTLPNGLKSGSPVDDYVPEYITPMDID